MNFDVKRLAIVGDLHFGIRNNSQQYLDFQSKWMENELTTIMDNNKCDSVFFLGDVLDNRVSISPLILKEVRRLFKMLASRYKNVFVLLGNHDIYYRNSREVHSLECLEDQGVTLFNDISEITFNDRKCIVLPWITRSDEKNVENLLVSNHYSYCFGHLEINNFEVIKGIVERDGLSQNLFANCGKVFSGHFHLRRKGRNIDYVGTPYELDWGDYGEDKGVTILDIKTDEENFEYTKGAPVHVKLKSNEISLKNINQKVIGNNFVDLKFHTGISEVERINYIEKVNSLSPLSFSTNDSDNISFDSNDDIYMESNIKDTMGFLKEYLDIIEMPDGINKKTVIMKLESLFNSAL